MLEREADGLWLAGRKHRKKPVYLKKLEGKTWKSLASQYREQDDPSVCAIVQQRSFHQQESRER
jgi:hypothetical protein